MFNFRSGHLSLLAGLLLLCWTPCPAQEHPGKQLPDATLKTTSVAAFKNGLGFFIRQGAARLADGQGRIPFVPDATLGSLWLAPNDSGSSIEELVAYRYKIPRERSAASLEELLRNNVGKTVTIAFNNKEYTGEVLGFSDGVNPMTASVTARDAILPPLPPSNQSRLLLLKVEGKVLALNPTYLTLISLPDAPNLVFKQDEEAKALRFTLKSAADSANLTMGYLQKGIGWTPSYLVSLQDEKTARITMQAVLTNDDEDLAGADVFFVVGVPNFEYSDKLSPMALEQTLTEFMQTAARRDLDRSNEFSNALMGQRTLPISGRNIVDLNATVGEVEGAPEEDLFLYTRPGVTLAKGERATYNIFAAPAACEHIYEWQVTDSPQVDIYGNPQNSNLPSDQKDINTVWHSLQLKNGSKFPWTSAPAMVISGTRPVSQDTLSYTPKGASTNLKLTIATDVRTDKKELEVDRQPRAVNRNGTEFDSVTVEGTLKVKNYKSKDIALKIYRSLIGEVLSATDKATTEKLAEVIRALNPTSRITWDLTLKAGEEKVITYRYKILVRS